MTPQDLAAKYNREILLKVMRRKDNGDIYTFVTPQVTENGIPYNMSIINENEELFLNYDIVVKANDVVFKIQKEEYAIQLWGDEWGKFVFHLKPAIGNVLVFEQLPD